ncbi:MAG: M20 family metallo-hydrolase [Syntrophales bacterium]|jgi:succinyl-diaminopimelate desuccinylase|nr:M20 family metallo-hydrolase [Syntrophales bacterium]MCK9528226.1 M20 family metallo-hydrolase [Syntrophales bacterium]MDX9921374.1 M20 family metallo-hydrolase [Syntrophales bacterium]
MPINSNAYASICDRIDSYTDDMIQLQTRLTAIPAIAPENGGNGEQEKARALLGILQGWGFRDFTSYDAPDERTSSGVRPNVVYTLQGRDRDHTVWIITHLDVVPPGELSLWSADPYRAVVKDGKIFGRGTEDNQQDMVSSIMAARAFLDTGITPVSNIGLAFVADEETASAKGLGYLLEHHRQLFKASDCIVVPDFGNVDGSGIEIAEKSMLWLRFRTTGKQCHASVPSLGNNAMAAGAHLTVRLERLKTVFAEADPLYDYPISTFEPTKKEATVPNINTIPGEDVFYLDCRVLPRYDLMDVMKKVREITEEIENERGVSVEVTVIQSGQAPAPTPVDAPVVRRLKEAVDEVYGISAVPVGIGGGTVAALLRREGLPVAAWSKVNRTAHQPDEHCDIATMTGNAKVFARLFLQERED